MASDFEDHCWKDIVPPDVIRHRMSMEPGLSSPATFRPVPERPSGRLTA